MALLISATYSVEDNKLRMYCSERLDIDLYKRFKELSFKWAPKQELFVAPKWTPNREDFCIEMAGEITAEESTLVERAEAKAERLDRLAVRRGNEANAYCDAADAISARFAGGQPILVGHHSERKARRDQEKMQSAMDKAIKARDSVDYWHYKAEGVERHANRKSISGVRARRIKTLLAELRNHQRVINHAYICIELWRSIETKQDSEAFEKLVLNFAGSRLKTGSTTPYLKEGSFYEQLRNDKISSLEVVEKCLSFHDYQANSPYRLRWLNHILNRLAYERSELGEVPRYAGEITAVILQAFARDNGTFKPKASKTDTGFIMVSDIAFPFHLADGKELELSTSSWCDLMQAVGYSVPAKMPRKVSNKKHAPLINPCKNEAEILQNLWNTEANSKHQSFHGTYDYASEVRTFNQAGYSQNSKGNYSPFSIIELDAQGRRVWHSWKEDSAPVVCRIRVFNGGSRLYAAESVLVIDDKPNKPLPICWPESNQEDVV